MTALELDAQLRSIDLKNISDEELEAFYDLLRMKEAELKWLINCRKHYKMRHPSTDTTK